MNEMSIHALAVLEGEVYAATDSGVFVSSDTGMHWSNSFDASIKQLAQCGETLYAAGDTTAFRLVRSRGQWGALNTGFAVDDRTIYSLSAGKYGIFIGTWHGRVLFSTDSGDTWEAVRPKLDSLSHGPYGPIFSIAATQGGVYLASTFGVYFCTRADSGLQLQNASGDMLPNGPQRLAALGRYVFVGMAENGIYRTDTHGSSWHEVNSGVARRKINVLRASNGMLLAGTRHVSVGGYPYVKSTVYMSLDTGNTWRDIGVGLPDSTSVSDVVTAGSYILAATDAHGLWRMRVTDILDNRSGAIQKRAQKHGICTIVRHVDNTVVFIFQMKRSQPVDAVLLDVRGRHIRSLLHGDARAGAELRCNVHALKSGHYILRVRTQNSELRQPVIVAR
jgi:hypothetical protein